MRLVDADKLIEELNKNSIFRTVTNAEGKSAIEIIEEQPTAFDVDKVLKKISERNREYHKKYRDYEEEEFGTLEEIFYQRAKTMAEAYDIVKAGEIDV